MQPRGFNTEEQILEKISESSSMLVKSYGVDQQGIAPQFSPGQSTALMRKDYSDSTQMIPILVYLPILVCPFYSSRHFGVNFISLPCLWHFGLGSWRPPSGLQDKRVGALASDLVFHAGTRFMAQQVATVAVVNFSADNRVPLWKYRFNTVPLL